jgi:hypothetical protein
MIKTPILHRHPLHLQGFGREKGFCGVSPHGRFVCCFLLGNAIGLHLRNFWRFLRSDLHRAMFRMVGFADSGRDILKSAMRLIDFLSRRVGIGFCCAAL